MSDSTVKFKADISQLKSQMQAAQRQVKLANSEFKAASASMEDWSSNAEGLKAKLKQLDTTLKSQKTQLSLLEEEYEKTTTQYGENSAAADRVKISINNMKASISKTESQIKTYESELSDCENGTGKFADELDDSKKSIDDVDGSMSNLSDGFTVMKGAMANLVAEGIKQLISGLKDLADAAIDAYKEFDEGYDNIIAKTGATGETLNSLTESYKNVSSSVITDLADAGNAIGEINTKFGLTGDELDNLTTKFIKFADLNDTDVTDSIDKVQAAMEAWGVDTSQAGDMLDLLNKVGQDTGVSMDSLSSSLTTNAASLKDMGFSVSDAATFLGDLEKAGVDSETVMTGLKKALSNSAKEGKTTKEALEDLQEAMQNADSDAEAMTEAIDLFGTKAGPAIADACKEGRISFEDLGTAMSDYVGSVDDTYEATQNGFDKISLTWQGMKTELGSFMSEIIDQYSPEIEEVLGTVKDAFKQIMEYVADHAPEIADTISSAITAFSDALVWVIENFEGIKSVAKAVATVLAATFIVNKVTAFITTLGSVISTIKTLKTATEAATASQKLLNIAQAATPVGMVTAAVAGLAAGLIYLVSKSDDAKEKTEILTKAEEEQIEKVNDLAQSYTDMSTKRDESVAAIETEYGYYEQLANELDDLVDANGKVKEGYEDRVNFILTTLNEAVGTEMELTDGVIQNYQDEKDAIYDLIEAKKAEAILSANEEAYTTAIQNKDTALQNYTDTYNTYLAKVGEMEEAYSKLTAAQEMSDSEFMNLNGIADAQTAVSMHKQQIEDLSDAYEDSKAAVGNYRSALDQAESTYVEYQATIKNYEGLSSAIISGDTDKINEALDNMVNNFITAKDGTRDTLEQQVQDFEEKYESLKTALENGNTAVTQEMVDGAKDMVDKASAELEKFPDEVKTYASDGMEIYSSTISSSANISNVKSNAARAAEAGTDEFKNEEDYKTAGKNNILGYIDGMGSVEGQLDAKARGISSGAVDELNEGQESHSPSEATKRSGENFGQGFINGMSNKESAIYQKAYSLAQTAINALKEGQQEGSPSKLTFQSGKYFVQGYINGIKSENNALKKAVTSMTKTALKTALNIKNFDFSKAATNVADYLADELSNKTDYMINKITYQNEKKLAEFDDTISSLESERDKKTSALQAKIDAATDDKLKNTLKSQKTAIENEYAALIATQNKYKDAYQSASSEMLTEFTTAINEYSTKAQDLINSTITAVGDKYQAKYDALIEKQTTLAEKLKSVGSLFEVSGAGIMTVNDLKEQTKQIKDYTSKLQTIKKKVSSDLFDEIASLDMKEGSAFIDRLLEMSDADLKAYSKAYDEKLNVAETMAEKTYKGDINKIAKDYKTELQKNFKDLPKQLEKIGEQTMKGFLSGLTKNTDYMSKEVKTFIKSMVSTFKTNLKIKSPSRVMMEIGDYTGEGLIEGLKGTINNVKKVAQTMAQSVATPLDNLKTNFGSMKASVGDSSSQIPQTTIINNYNLTQNNTSPKSLSALETYQARRQQVAMVKAMT